MEEEYQCDDCGEKNIRPFDNGDGKTRCEKCAVEFYKASRSWIDDLPCATCGGSGIKEAGSDYVIYCLSCDGWGKRRK